MTTAYKTCAATGRLPVWDAELGWHYPKQHAAAKDDWASPDDFFVTPLASQAPRAASVGDPFAAAVRSWMQSFPALGYHAALVAVARQMPDLAAGYAGELGEIPNTSSSGGE